MYTKKQMPLMAVRRHAQLKGAMTYEGGPCAYGHTLRYDIGGKCVDCAKLSSRIQYLLSKLIRSADVSS